MCRPIDPRAAHAIGRLKGMPPTGDALPKGSGADRRIGRRTAQTRRLAPRIRIVHHGQDPVRDLRRTGSVRVEFHRAIATIGRPAATARMSRHRAQTAIGRRLPTRMAIARMSLRRIPTLRHRVPTRRRVGVTPHLPARTQRRVEVTRRLLVRIPPLVAPIPRPAGVMAVAEEALAAAVGVVEAHAAVEGADLAAVEEGRTEAVLTDTERFQLQPALSFGAGFFYAEIICGVASAYNSSTAHGFSRVNTIGRFLIGHGGKARWSEVPDAVHNLASAPRYPEPIPEKERGGLQAELPRQVQERI